MSINTEHISKTCPKCGEVKQKTEFYKRTSAIDGLGWCCKACIKAAGYVRNPTKQRAARAKWRAANRDKHNAINAAYRDANRTNIVRLEKSRAASAAWNAANPEARRILNQNRRARKREAGGRLSKGLTERLFMLQLGKCACGCKQQLGNDYHLDHIMPLSLGGTNTDDNIQLLRSECNFQKHAKHPIDFMQQRGFLL